MDQSTTAPAPQSMLQRGVRSMLFNRAPQTPPRRPAGSASVSDNLVNQDHSLVVQLSLEDTLADVSHLAELKQKDSAVSGETASRLSLGGRAAIITHAAQLRLQSVQQQPLQPGESMYALPPEVVAQAEQWAAQKRYALDDSSGSLIKQDLLEAFQDHMLRHGADFMHRRSECQDSLRQVMRRAWETKIRTHADQEFNDQQWAFQIQERSLILPMPDGTRRSYRTAMAVGLFGKIALICVPLQLELDMHAFKSALDISGGRRFQMEGDTYSGQQLAEMSIDDNHDELFVCSLLPDNIEGLLTQLREGLAGGLKDSDRQHYVDVSLQVLSHQVKRVGAMLAVLALHIDPMQEVFSPASLLVQQADQPPIRGGNWLFGPKPAAPLLEPSWESSSLVHHGSVLLISSREYSAEGFSLDDMVAIPADKQLLNRVHSYQVLGSSPGLFASHSRQLQGQVAQLLHNLVGMVQESTGWSPNMQLPLDLMQHLHALQEAAQMEAHYQTSFENAEALKEYLQPIWSAQAHQWVQEQLSSQQLRDQWGIVQRYPEWTARTTPAFTTWEDSTRTLIEWAEQQPDFEEQISNRQADDRDDRDRWEENMRQLEREHRQLTQRLMNQVFNPPRLPAVVQLDQQQPAGQAVAAAGFFPGDMSAASSVVTPVSGLAPNARREPESLSSGSQQGPAKCLRTAGSPIPPPVFDESPAAGAVHKHESGMSQHQLQPEEQSRHQSEQQPNLQLWQEGIDQLAASSCDHMPLKWLYLGVENWWNTARPVGIGKDANRLQQVVADINVPLQVLVSSGLVRDEAAPRAWNQGRRQETLVSCITVRIPGEEDAIPADQQLTLEELPYSTAARGDKAAEDEFEATYRRTLQVRVRTIFTEEGVAKQVQKAGGTGIGSVSFGGIGDRGAVQEFRKAVHALEKACAVLWRLQELIFKPDGHPSVEQPALAALHRLAELMPAPCVQQGPQQLHSSQVDRDGVIGDIQQFAMQTQSHRVGPSLAKQ